MILCYREGQSQRESKAEPEKSSSLLGFMSMEMMYQAHKTVYKSVSIATVNLGRNPDKSYKFSSLLFTVTSTVNLFHISSNSRNLLYISTVKLLYTVKDKGGKPVRKP